MSRLGVVRWLPTHGLGLNVSTNSSSSPPVVPASKEEWEWLQADLLVSACMILLLLLHTYYCQHTKVRVSSLLAATSLVATLVLAPLAGFVLLVCALYRRLVSALLSVLHGARFAGLLHGTDACWALEDDTSRSVINVLALADFSFIVAASTQDDEPLQTISELIQDRLLSDPVPFLKLQCYIRHSSLGYSYWEKQESISITDHVRWMDIEDQGDLTITEPVLKNFVSSVMNSPLPADHAAGWEILVGRYPIQPSSDLLDAMETGSWMTRSCAGVRYPVLFRVHHSMGDGVALVNLLLDSLGDPCTRSNTPVSALRPHSPCFNRNFVRSKTPTIPEEPEEPVIISSWQESDDPRCAPRPASCDLKSISLDIPTDETFLRRRNTYDFTGYSGEDCQTDMLEDLKSTVRVACRKVLNFIDETKDFKDKLDGDPVKDFDIVVNDGLSGEFLKFIDNANPKNLYISKSVEGSKQLNNLLRKCTLWFCMFINFLLKLASSFKAHAAQWSVVFFAPATIFNQSVTQTQDSNALHGPKLSGHKVAAWHLEQQDDPDQLLMAMIKRIRSKTGARFSDVLLTAVSTSLESFYARCNEIPQQVTVIVPARLGLNETQASTTVIKTAKFSTKVTKIRGSVDNKLENKFSVALLTLPIASHSGNLEPFSKLNEVKRHCDLLRNSADYLVNYWLMRVVATLLPSWVLRPMLRSTHSTLVLSNLPGPTRLTKLAGHTLYDLVFWVPNRTTTGVGVTVLSYAGRLQLGLMADRALVACQQDAQDILDGIPAAIHHMDSICTA